MHSSRFRLLPVVFCFLFTTTLSAREWSDTAGRKVKGDFIELTEDGKVQLNVDGKILSIPLYRFSQADQEHIDSIKNGRKAPPEEAVDDPINSSSVPNPFGSEPVKSPFDSDENAPSRASAPGIDAAGSRAVDSSDTEQLDRRDLTKTRTWVDSSGISIKAKYIRIHNGMVVLSQSGRIVQSDFYKLSPGDQKFLRDHLTVIGKADTIPAPPATIQAPNNSGPPQLAGGNTRVGGYNPGSTAPPYSPGGGVRPPAYTPPPYDPGSRSTNSGSMAGRSNPSRAASPTSPGSNRGGSPYRPSHAGSNNIASNSHPPSNSHRHFGHTMPYPRVNSAPRSIIPKPTVPPMWTQPECEVSYRCNGCGTQVSDIATRCPVCRRDFDYSEDEYGNRTNLNRNKRSSLDSRFRSRSNSNFTQTPGFLTFKLIGLVLATLMGFLYRFSR